MEISGLALFLVLLVLPTDAVNTTVHNGISGQHRKLLISAGRQCKTSDLAVNQGLSTELPSGIPTYNVEIHNQCSSACNIARIHLHCGAFSSNTLINPFVFRRVKYDDCVVNDDKPIAFGEVVSFQYATTKPYPLSVAAFICT